MAINIISVIRSYQYVAKTVFPSHVVVTSFQNWLPAFHPFLAQEQSKSAIAINYYFNQSWSSEHLTAAS